MIEKRFRPFADYPYSDEIRFKAIREELEREWRIVMATGRKEMKQNGRC